MAEFRGTPGPWVYSKDRHTHDCIIHSKNAKVENGQISPDNGGVVGSSEWIWIKEEDAKLIAAAPDLLEALIKARHTICKLKLSMVIHPDCVEGSEFDDYTSIAQEVEDEIETLIGKTLGE